MNKKYLIMGFVIFAAFYFFNSPKRLAAWEIDSSCDIVVFTTASCPACKMVKQYLKARSIAWCEKNVEQSADNYLLFKDMGGVGVPLAVIGTEVIHGYSPREYQAAISDL